MRVHLPQSKLVRTLAGSLRQQDKPARQFSLSFFLLVILCAAAIMLWRADRNYSLGIYDLYPLYYGAKAWLHTGNAYDLASVTPTIDHTQVIYRVGNAYPLPAVLLVLPLTLFSPKVAAILWLGLVTSGLLVVLRLSGVSCWFILYWPILDSLRLEQYTPLVTLLQILALWALQQRRYWLLATCCALMLTKPNQTCLFVVVLIVLGRCWYQQIAMSAIVWGGSFVLDPHWPAEWFHALAHYQSVAQWPHYWALALFALPLILVKDYIGGAIALQYLITPAPLISAYPASTTPLSVLRHPQSIWLIPASYLWFITAAFLPRGLAVALAFFVPVVILAFARWWGQHLRTTSSSITPEMPL